MYRNVSQIIVNTRIKVLNIEVTHTEDLLYQTFTSRKYLRTYSLPIRLSVLVSVLLVLILETILDKTSFRSSMTKATAIT